MAFEDWYRDLHPRVVALLAAVTGDLVLASTATTDAFAAAHERWGRVRALASPDRWLYRVALRSARRRALVWRVRRDGPAAPDAAGVVELRPGVWRALGALPRRQRTAVGLRYVLDLPEAEAARVMNVSRGAVSADLVAARRAMLALLPGSEVDPGTVGRDLEGELRPLLGHPGLPGRPPLDEVAGALRRRRSRRRTAALAAAAAAVRAAGLGVAAREAGPSGTAASPTPGGGAPSTDPPATVPPTTATPPTVPATVPPATATPPTVPPATVPPATAEPPDGAAPVRSSTIRDTDIGSGPGTVSYSGDSWTRCGGCTVVTDDASYYYGYRVGQAYTVRFRGVRLQVFAPDDRHGGVAEVTVDGRPAATPRVDFLTTGTPANGLRWDSGALPDGAHTVTFTILPGRSDNVALFDRAEVYTR
ncbi:MAG TPA: sigma factor-like helix-turn-helix DNA-binding protein [Acidimicrobiales bacterium]|nr:sigma factor-like helix-turn-helix DNA-binding protein [Acidimicrobiales bacterium]